MGQFKVVFFSLFSHRLQHEGLCSSCHGIFRIIIDGPVSLKFISLLLDWLVLRDVDLDFVFIWVDLYLFFFFVALAENDYED